MEKLIENKTPANDTIYETINLGIEMLSHATHPPITTPTTVIDTTTAKDVTKGAGRSLSLDINMFVIVVYLIQFGF